ITSIEDVRIHTSFSLLEMIMRDVVATFDEIFFKFDHNQFLEWVLEDLETKALITKIGDDKWKLSDELIDKLKVEKIPEDADQDEKLKAIPKKEDRFDERKIKRKASEEFLETIDLDKKPKSVVKSRIRAELMSKEAKKNEAEAAISSSVIEDMFDDVLDLPMDEFLEDFDDILVVEEKGGKPTLGGPLIEILKEQGYISESLSTEEELSQVPEYEILSIIIKDHPIPLEKIEESSKSTSVSLVLSNLQADELIEQTNDYQWTISSKVMQHLKQFITQRRESPSQPNKDQILRQQVVRDTQDEKQFIIGLHKVGYVQSPDYSLSDVLHIPEFQILRIIKDKGPINVDQIKEIASKMPPVQVTRMLSRLEADNHIVQTESGQYQLSMDFVSILVTGEPVS
ncbi:MAG: hypothetical protein ACW98K_15645, partial [Candidatus Kariarchaeaceae archaeon]